MITRTDETWRAVRIADRASIDYLNRLFAEGWYLMFLDADGISYLAFQLPASTPSWTRVRDEHHALDIQREPALTVVVLRSGEHPGRQRAVVMERDESGRIDLSERPWSRSEWRLLMMGLELDGGESVAIIERAEFGHTSGW